jgi:dTDP-4-amino-4,6-dideoxygalactose transaminase
LSLHSSDFYKDKHDKRELLNSDYFTDCLVRLPLYFELEQNDLDAIVQCIKNNFN